ncbi:hypothetical protein JKP88DRAFT_248156 [Tribonema minus]|uniref:Uncharacterized protein n=1 Tax=Tribonema minus TaxID=303371 RepID=A0A835YQN2_9STRA|nr:hypothetical protein JKP88DRAFT_248156 [Tribonema minus]
MAPSNLDGKKYNRRMTSAIVGVKFVPEQQRAVAWQRLRLAVFIISSRQRAEHCAHGYCRASMAALEPRRRRSWATCTAIGRRRSCCSCKSRAARSRLERLLEPVTAQATVAATDPESAALPLASVVPQLAAHYAESQRTVVTGSAASMHALAGNLARPTWCIEACMEGGGGG